MLGYDLLATEKDRALERCTLTPINNGGERCGGRQSAVRQIDAEPLCRRIHDAADGMPVERQCNGRPKGAALPFGLSQHVNGVVLGNDACFSLGLSRRAGNRPCRDDKAAERVAFDGKGIGQGEKSFARTAIARAHSGMIDDARVPSMQHRQVVEGVGGVAGLARIIER